MLRVYFCRLPEHEPVISPGLLSAYRKEKLLKQKNARVRLQSLCAELLLLHALADSGFPPDGPMDIGSDENGKPLLRGGECCFSLSHSADALLCALCSREIGADIQIQKRARAALMKRCFTLEEQSYVSGMEDQDAAFSEIWSKKESFCKLDGRGLALSPVSFSVFDDEIASLLWHGTEGEYHISVCSDAVKTENVKLTRVEASVLFP